MLFQWTRLASNQFRLLERRTPLPSGEPSFVLKTFSCISSSLPAYAALTYPKPSLESSTASVVLNGRSFSISKRALEALLQVNIHDAEGCEYLWIDCLCVNQKDENEKTVQEGMMERIFEGAKCVIAFLPGNTRGVKTLTPSPSPSEREEFTTFARTFGALGQLPGGYHLWSPSEMFTETDVVLYAGSDRFERREVERALGLVQQENQRPPSDQTVATNSSL